MRSKRLRGCGGAEDLREFVRSSVVPFREREKGPESAVQGNCFIGRQNQRNGRGLRGPLVQVEGDRESTGLPVRYLGLTSKAEVALGGRQGRRANFRLSVTCRHDP